MRIDGDAHPCSPLDHFLTSDFDWYPTTHIPSWCSRPMSLASRTTALSRFSCLISHLSRFRVAPGPLVFLPVANPPTPQLPRPFFLLPLRPRPDSRQMAGAH
ncbi:hypothetical protein B0H17DRAFT_1210864 [Mycena rosella]|uniref:Uncharacterized protein n=1 Tax=Mycena rosella TaxID=1033263 RepID=A0AAD7CW32_MYCRO|nr:hypothetical protein B0H17DRAFT_1210864 [Mycena rosella]